MRGETTRQAAAATATAAASSKQAQAMMRAARQNSMKFYITLPMQFAHLQFYCIL
jgi:hypothetical protein